MIAAGAVLSGIGVLLLAVDALRDGRTAVGWVVMTCGLRGIAFGAGGLLALRRRR